MAIRQPTPSPTSPGLPYLDAGTLVIYVYFNNVLKKHVRICALSFCLAFTCVRAKEMPTHTQLVSTIVIIIIFNNLFLDIDGSQKVLK
jgi:hypothetical protein